MKKLVTLCLLAIFIATSCQKDDQTGIPPIILEETNPEPENVEFFNASEIDLSVYESKKGAKVSVKGNISVEGTRAYFTLKDNTKILIFAPKSVFDGLSDEIRNKLKINGQELTATGVFKDFTDRAGTLIREIEYSSASDLVFGEATTPSVEVFNASEIDLSVYESKKGAKVSVKGNISVEGTRAYFILKDNTKILIFAPKSVFDGLSDEIRNKLKTNGQELTVTGVFKDFKNNSGTIREIEYTSASDLVFGQTPSTPSVSEINALETNLSDVYEEDKAVVLKGKISVENNRSWITFKNGEKIQIFIQNYKNLSQSAKDKLNLPDQEVTLTGKFKTYNSTKQIQIVKEADIAFGTTPNQTSASYVFDFESITPKGNSYDQEGTLSATDGTTLTYKARTGELGKYAINGKGLMLKKDDKLLPMVKIAFKGSVKQLKLKYKAANTSTKNRILAAYQGDETSTPLKKIEFKVGEEGELVLDLNQTTDYTITIKVLSDPAITIDDISWEK